MSAFYNENDPKIAAWLRQLIQDGLTAPGIVDERSVTEIKSHELIEYTQCHFFAGIGGWSYALRLAGWPDDKAVWTGSCPCQPFSQAGKRQVDTDERHLWPAFRAAIAERRPSIVFGEQVAAKDGRIWLAGVRADLEALGYAVGAADLCAAGISAPHIRQRLYWVAESKGEQMGNGRQPRLRTSESDRVGQSNGNGRQTRNKTAEAAGHGNSVITTGRSSSGLAHTHQRRRSSGNAETQSSTPALFSGQSGENARLVNADGYHSHWWSGPMQVGGNCIEGEVERGGRKYRAQWRVKPGLSLLADGIPGRVAQLSGFGNAIVPELAAEFIQAYLETQTESLT